MTKSRHVWPAIHNAMWPGLVGKGPDSEPPIDLDTMLDLTAAAATNGARFDGVDLFLCDPHVSIDATGDELRRLRERIAKHDFVVGSLVAPVWPPTGGGAAMGSADDRKNFVTQVRKACVIAGSLTISAFDLTAWSASTRRRARVNGPRIPRATPGRSPDFPGGVRRGGRAR